MSSSGLIYAVIVGAWAAYLVPMWLRRQDELNEARPTERFSTAIRLLSGRAGMERRYARDLRARSAQEGEPDAVDPDAVTDSVDVRAFAVPPTRRQEGLDAEPLDDGPEAAASAGPDRDQPPAPAPDPASVPAPQREPVARRASSAQTAAARAQRSKVLARRRRTTVMLFLAFTLGTVIAAVGGLAFLWAPGVPAVLLSAYIAYLRAQERRRFAYQMDRRRAEAAAQRLRERRPRTRAFLEEGTDADEADAGRDAGTDDTELSALAADRRALVEQTDHAEWVDQQRERQRRPGHGESWDPVPVPLPTYVTAPVAPRATSDVDLGAPDTWSSARSSAVAPEQEAGRAPQDGGDERAEPAAAEGPADGRGQARPQARTRSRGAGPASARRARERGRTPLFDQFEDGDRPRAANE
ncbi:gephyrin-like molybdotransferase receptor GlpR [Streptomyces achromogenes]|uniref:divisome protein SepX/GlpR n=1 Tax=Streptomyces achromogenes TaxID=67255 RepID=UPI003702EC81